MLSKLVTFFGLWLVCGVCQADIYAFEGLLTVQRYVGLGCEKAGVVPGFQYEMTVGLETLGDNNIRGFLSGPKITKGRFEGKLNEVLALEYAIETGADSLGHSLVIRREGNRLVATLREKDPGQAEGECNFAVAEYFGTSLPASAKATERFETLKDDFLIRLERMKAYRKNPSAFEEVGRLGEAAERLAEEKKSAQAASLFEKRQGLLEALYGPQHWTSYLNLEAWADQLEDAELFTQALDIQSQTLRVAEKLYAENPGLIAKQAASMSRILKAMRRYPEAIAFAGQALAITEKIHGEEHQHTATALFNLVSLHRSIDQTQDMLPLALRALRVSEKISGAETLATARNLSNVAHFYRQTGEFEKALPLLRRALAISETIAGVQAEETGVRMNELAGVLVSMARLDEALLLYKGALLIVEKVNGEGHLFTASAVNNVGLALYFMGQYEACRGYYTKALEIQDQASRINHLDGGVSLGNLGKLFRTIGEYGKAESFYKRALAMAQSTPGSDPIDVAGRFVGLAELYLDLGQSEKAINLALQALEIFERVSGPEHPSVGTVLNNLALMYEAQRNYIKAVEMHRRSLRISEIRLGLNHPSTGVSLYNIGSLFIRARELEEAAPLLERALVIAEASQGAEHPSTGRRLSQLGDLHRARKRPAEAMTYYLKAYSIARRAGDVALAVQVQESLANHFRELDQIALAIYFGKEAVNSLQTLRANAQTLDRTLQRSLLATNKSTYQNLAQWLIEAGRLVEAQEVISMLKEEELQGFTQRRGTDDPRKTKIDFDLKERNWREKARGLEDRPGYSEALGALLAHLLDENNAAKVQPIADRTQLDNAEASKLSPVLRELREKGLAKTAALQILVSENKVQTIVTLADALYAKEVLINVDDLRAQVEQFRKVLQSPNQDPLPLAKGLYTVLLAPLMADLKTAGVEHLMLSLTDTLRYIPFGALHDGEKFLVQSYQLSMMTEAASGARLEQIATAWTVSGLGVSEKVSDEFQALPAVGRELNAIVRTAASPSGSLPGEIYINGAFTAERYRSVIEQAPTVIHLATHFKFSAGTESQSYLLLGDGQPLSLAEMMSDRYRFKGLDLLTLSACETGIGGPAGKDGREIEGLGAQAQRYGASAVLATLWQVADDSTFQLMKHFYALRGQAQSLKGTRMNKSEALREAQVSMIDGKFRPLDPQATQATLLRGASVANEIRAGTSQAQRYVFNPAKPFAHPFYWAPFVLMGNWL